MRYYETVKEFSYAGFDIVVEWSYEDLSVRDAFDESEEEYAEMERRLDLGIDTHYLVRVRAMYDGVEMGCAYLGSCYAYDCSPEEDIDDGIGGYLEDLIEQAVDQARDEAVRMLNRLKEDFLV